MTLRGLQGMDNGNVLTIDRRLYETGLPDIYAELVGYAACITAEGRSPDAHRI